MSNKKNKIEILESSGTYAYLSGNRYPVDQIDSDRYRLFSETNGDGSFTEDELEGFIRDVTKEDIDYGVLIEPSAEFQGVSYPILGWVIPDFIILGNDKPINGIQSELYDQNYFANKVPLDSEELVIKINEHRAFNLPTSAEFKNASFVRVLTNLQDLIIPESSQDGLVILSYKGDKREFKKVELLNFLDTAKKLVEKDSPDHKKSMLKC